MASTIATASSFGHSDCQTVPPISPALRRGFCRGTASRLSSPARAAASSVPADMPHHLFVQPGLDLHGPLHRLAGVDAARALAGHVELFQHAAGTAAEQYHPVAEPDGLAHLMGDEQHTEPLPPPDALQQLVQEVTGH